MAVSPPPRKPAASTIESSTRNKLDEKKIDEKKIDAIINRGSSSVASSSSEVVQLKNFNIKITASTLESIDEVRAKRPRKPTSPKLGISTQDWLLEAIAEKLERERKRYKIGAI